MKIPIVSVDFSHVSDTLKYKSSELWTDYKKDLSWLEKIFSYLAELIGCKCLKNYHWVQIDANHEGDEAALTEAVNNSDLSPKLSRLGRHGNQVIKQVFVTAAYHEKNWVNHNAKQ